MGWWHMGMYGGIGVVLVIGLLIIGVQAWLEYRTRTYDWTLALKYQGEFGRLVGKRIRAAKLLINMKDDLTKLTDERIKQELEEIDPVLDFFEDIGFYMKGYQISPEVVHHHFYHWIRGYWKSAQSYVDAWRDEDIGKDATRWSHLKELYDVTTEIEESKGNYKRPFDRDDFLGEEVRLSFPSLPHLGGRP